MKRYKIHKIDKYSIEKCQKLIENCNLIFNSMLRLTCFDSKYSQIHNNTNCIFNITIIDSLNKKVFALRVKQINLLFKNEKIGINIPLNKQYQIKEISIEQEIKKPKPLKYNLFGFRYLFHDTYYFEDSRIQHFSNLIKRNVKDGTSFEKIIIQFIDIQKLNFEYIGDGKFFIGFKNPDFIDYKNKLIIEVYYSYWKKSNYEIIRNNYFKKWGYKTLFINEKEIQNEKYKDKILSFVNNS